MPAFVRRFRRTALLLALAACLAVATVLVAASVVTGGPDPTGAVVAWAIGAGLIVAGTVFAINSLRRGIALRQVGTVNPHGAVFLARRQPALVSDLATYLGADSDVYDEVSDRWVVASIDERGMTAWSVGRDSRELLLVPWEHIGSIEPTALESGRVGIAVDVKPFPTPLVVSVGYSAFGIMAAFGRRGVAEVVALANALRPAPVVE